MVIDKKEIADILKIFKDWSSPKLSTIDTQGIMLKGNKLIANNCSEAITTTINNSTDEEFIIPLAAIDLIDKMPPGAIEITKPDAKVVVESKVEKIKSSFPTFEVELFPALEIDEEQLVDAEHIEMKGCDFDDIISQIFYACPSNSTNPVLNGIMVDGSSGNEVDFVACDGYRLAVAVEKAAWNITVAIPREAVKKALQIAKSDDKINIYKYKNKVIIYRNNYVIYANLYTGDFVDYKAAFPESFAETVSIDKGDFDRAVKRSILCYGKERGACSILTGIGDKLTISIKNNANEYQETLGADTFENAMRIGVNGKFITDVLATIVKDKITLKYATPVKPMVIKAEGHNVSHLFLPMKL